MKLITTLLIASTLTFCGCKTTETVHTWPDGTTTTETHTQVDPERTAAAVKVIIPPAVQLTVAKYPEAKQYIQKAQLVICGIVSVQGDMTPETLEALVGATGIKEINTPEAKAALSTVYGIYQVYYKDVVAQKIADNEKLHNLSIVLTAICEALGHGLPAEPAQ